MPEPRGTLSTAMGAVLGRTRRARIRLQKRIRPWSMRLWRPGCELSSSFARWRHDGGSEGKSQRRVRATESTSSGKSGVFRIGEQTIWS